MNDVTDGRSGRDGAAGKPRFVRCQVCETKRPARLEDDARLLEQVVVVGDGKVDSIAYVGACRSCDKDVCARCAKWVDVTGSRGALDSLAVACRVPACPKCGEMLAGKSQIDLKRLEEGLAILPTLPPPAARELANRLDEICLQEYVLLKQAGAFDTIRESLRSKSG